MIRFKKGVHFILDDHAQISYDILKVEILIPTPLLSPPNYSNYFLLYIVAYESTIGMVLVQEDEFQQENVVYYLSKKCG